MMIDQPYLPLHHMLNSQPYFHIHVFLYYEILVLKNKNGFIKYAFYEYLPFINDFNEPYVKKLVPAYGIIPSIVGTYPR